MNTPNIPILNIPQEVVDILTTEQKAQIFDLTLAKLQSPATPVEEIPIETSGSENPKSKKGYHKNVPIWEMRKFKQYAAPRVYDPKTGMWKTKRSGRRGRPLYLPFETLIIMINDYKKGIHPEETHRKLNLHSTISGFRTTLYVYRGGGFNEGIYENARKYGYNPQDLISTECDEYWRKVNAK